jgi:hypothetical protein
VWYVLSNEDKDVSFRKDHWPRNGSSVSSVIVLEKVTLNRNNQHPVHAKRAR